MTTQALDVIIKLETPTGTYLRTLSLRPEAFEDHPLHLKINYVTPMKLWRVEIQNAVMFLPDQDVCTNQDLAA